MADFDAGAVLQVVEEEAAVGVEEQMRGIGRPLVGGHLVAVAEPAAPESEANLALLTRMWDLPDAGSRSMSSPPSM